MTKNFAATSNKFGEPLKAPSKQTILPIIEYPNGRLHGFYPIATTTFDGTEREFTLAEGPVAINTVTLPQRAQDGSADNYRVPQYMAAVFTYEQCRDRWYAGHVAFIDVNSTGYYSRYVMPTQGFYEYFGRGTLLGNLAVNMAAIPVTPPDAPTPPPGEDANLTLYWGATMNISSTQLDCAFFDFNWVELFNTTFSTYNPNTTIVEPLTLEVVSNPAGGVFKAALVTGLGGQAYLPGGGVQFNTVRIVRLNDAVPGDYVFQFLIKDTRGGSTPVSLTLTIPPNT